MCQTMSDNNTKIMPDVIAYCSPQFLQYLYFLSIQASTVAFRYLCAAEYLPETYETANIRRGAD